MNKDVAKQVAVLGLFVTCIAALVLNSALHLHFTRDGDTALIFAAVWTFLKLV